MSKWRHDEKPRNKPKRTGNRPAKGSCALCPVFGRCGGCSQLDVPYARQLATKERQVRALFADLAAPEALLPILGMDDPFHYRNKVGLPLRPGQGTVREGVGKGEGRPTPRSGKPAKGKGREGGLSRADILTGMYETGTHRLIPTDACAIENETAKRVTLAIRDIMARWNMEPYDEDAGTGFVRHAVVRVGHTSGEVLVTVVTNGDQFPASKAFCRELARRVPEVTTVVQNVNTRQTNVILGDKERVLFGPGFILDTLCGLTFRISSQSFYQVNATQTEVLYDEAIRLANLTGVETVIDAYCGTGTIGLVAGEPWGGPRYRRRFRGGGHPRRRQQRPPQRCGKRRVRGAGRHRFHEGACSIGGASAAPRPAHGSAAGRFHARVPRGRRGACPRAHRLHLVQPRNPGPRRAPAGEERLRGARHPAVDMFPHTDHVESIVMLEREDRRGGARGGAHRARTV